MHEPDYYTFLVRRSDGAIGELSVYTTYYAGGPLIKTDAVGVSYVTYVCGSGYTCLPFPQHWSHWIVYGSQVEIHLRTVDELNGAGWDHGKFGRGTTTVVR